MDVAREPIALAPDDERDLRVRLEAEEPVDDMHALVLERARPADVALLVEARLELHQHRHLLPLTARLEERLDDRRVLAHAIQRLLDGEHVRIVRGRPQELDDRRERVEGVVQEDVLPADGGEQVLRPPKRTALACSGGRSESADRSARWTRAARFSESARGPSTTYTSRGSTSRLLTSKSRTPSGMVGAMTRRTTDPNRRSRTPCSTEARRSAASISCSSISASRVT